MESVHDADADEVPDGSSSQDVHNNGKTRDFKYRKQANTIRFVATNIISTIVPSSSPPSLSYHYRLHDNSDMSPSRRGRMRCRMRPATPSATNSAAVATYPHPRNGFFPPIHDTVEITIDFVPLYGFTG